MVREPREYTESESTPENSLQKVSGKMAKVGTEDEGKCQCPHRCPMPRYLRGG